jgi:hypothetical protein
MKTATIVGLGPGFSRAPKDAEGEIWTLNAGLFLLPRIDKYFVMDPVESKGFMRVGKVLIHEGGKDIEKKVTPKSFAHELESRDIEFISAYPSDIKTYTPYPLEEVVSSLGVPYFTNTISYMIAYAIVKGYQRIVLYGVNQAALSEYIHHKPCVEFWLGLALGQGVSVDIQGWQSELLRNYQDTLYGYRKPYGAIINKKDE